MARAFIRLFSGRFAGAATHGARMSARVAARCRFAATVGLGVSLALPLAAAAEPAVGCPVGSTLVRVDARSCPSLPRQPALVVRRACCERRDGRISCGEFPACPTRSPS
jgi:hypothetical protein